MEDAARRLERKAGECFRGTVPGLEGQRRDGSLPQSPAQDELAHVPQNRDQKGLLAGRPVVDLGEVRIEGVEQTDVLETSHEIRPLPGPGDHTTDAAGLGRLRSAQQRQIPQPVQALHDLRCSP